MRGRTAFLSALFVGHVLVGCGFHGEAAPVASSDQIKTKTSVSPPFASAVRPALANAAATPTVPPVVSASMPVSTPSAATSAATAPSDPPDDGEIGVGDPKLGVGGANPRKAKKLVTKLPPAIIDGSLPADAVTRVLRREMSAIRKCWEDARKENAKLGGGTIDVAFAVDSKGAVKDAKESGSTLKDGKVGACVTSLVGKLTFPAAEGKDAKVTSSVLFTPMKSTVNGKELADVTADDVKAALKELGWTDITATPPKDGASPVVITAKKGDKTVTITFSPSKKGEKDKAVSEDAKKKLVEEGIVLDDGILLAIVIDKDKKAADELLQALVKAEEAAPAK